MEQNSDSVLKHFLMGLRFSGFYPFNRYKPLYYCYGILLFVLFSLGYPLSTVIAISHTDSKSVLFSDLSFALSLTMCCIKVFNMFIKREKIFELRKCLSRLDARFSNDEEVTHFRNIIKLAQRFLFTFICLYFTGAMLSGVVVAFSKERRLYSPAWFPWDWKNSSTGYSIVICYQQIGLLVQGYQQFVTDTYLGIFMWLLKGHLGALAIRIRNIGTNPRKSTQENYQELVQSIKDHGVCLRCYELCQNIGSTVMLLQFICTQCLACMAAVYVVFLKESATDFIFFVVFCICAVMEISLSCYCGSKLTEESNKITGALYSCNWTDQDRRFKKALLIFMQQTQRPWLVYAGGIIDVSLATWLAVLKSTYSLFAVLSKLK